MELQDSAGLYSLLFSVFGMEESAKQLVKAASDAVPLSGIVVSPGKETLSATGSRAQLYL